MFEIFTYEDDDGRKPYAEWLVKLPDRQAISRVLVRVSRMAGGNFGDCKPVADGVWELLIDWGPGYRVYFIQQQDICVVLLAGGEKSSQDRDIRQAKALARDL